MCETEFRDTPPRPGLWKPGNLYCRLPHPPPPEQPGAAPIGSGREGGLCSCEGQNRPSTLALTLADGPRTRATTLSFLVVPSHERERIVTMFLMQR